MNGKASACQIYPCPFCSQICFGLKDELVARHIGGLPLEHVYSRKEFYDDEHGKLLNKDMAIEARRL